MSIFQKLTRKLSKSYSSGNAVTIRSLKYKASTKTIEHYLSLLQSSGFVVRTPTKVIVTIDPAGVSYTDLRVDRY